MSSQQVDLQALAWQVAQAKVPCPERPRCEKGVIYDLITHMPTSCSTCYGTGEVRLPEMSQECPGGGNYDTGHFDCIGGHLARMTEKGMAPFQGEHELCRGTSRVPIAPDAGKLLDLTQEAGYFIEIVLGANSVRVDIFSDIHSFKPLARVDGREFTLTVYEAVVKAMEASK